jgi:superfamily I DNA and/or RNA helicase
VPAFVAIHVNFHVVEPCGDLARMGVIPAAFAAVSDLQYEGRLLSAPVTSLRHLDGVSPDVIAVPVEHRDNTTSSPEEAAAVVALVRELIGRAWTPARDDQAGVPRPLEPSDIIIVAAFNTQVRLFRRELNEAGFGSNQVGTVDKFQGREEVVVLVSMATSSAEDLPRGIDFLLSPNRLKVAISRAQWACSLVHSPALLDSSPSSVTGIERLGRFIELLKAPVDE